MTRATTSPVPGRDDLTCPVPRVVVKRMLKHAWNNPWRGDTPLLDPRHVLDTTAITDPGRPTRILLSLDYGYHGSGWFANSQWERNLHVSISHPRIDKPRVMKPASALAPAHPGYDLDVPDDAEVRAWGLVFYGLEHAKLAWFEPAASVFDPHRSPGVVHLRLFIDEHGEPFMPEGEPYTLKPWADGTSPPKVTEGRAGADVR